MPDFLVFTAIIPKLFCSKIILDLHDPMPELYMSKYHVQENNMTVRLLKYLENQSVNFSDFILTANPYFQKLFLARNPELKEKIAVILNCPDPKIFHSQRYVQNSKYFTLLYMGTIDERFNLELVIEALNILKKKISHLKFIVIPKIDNEGPYFRKLKEKISQYHLESQVIISHPLPLEKIAIKLKQADIGIVLAKNGQFTESIMPVKLLEFIAMEIPVIATKTKILVQYFSDKMLYFLRENSPEEISQVIYSFYKNKRLRMSLSKNAKIFLKKYNWKNEEIKYQKLIDYLIN
ncbi:hypothetical protein A2Y99_02880 [Candidatus Gottesmanbacteria bacterium RBG_13_37_7]|uniref:Glycosyl transferase family 1 domain-containing protein n=1 Tax=Candidatus Gottesmanbacteria bacterium RBG_13_37_7 TaxID=1798369 RepID=A0A1F5YG38_9BACT|nr:MAG: hypothetical protein A2Y99_02880 [Candidatus Gottesmanbacteria bacterium RBG_13_37_7]